MKKQILLKVYLSDHIEFSSSTNRDLYTEQQLSADLSFWFKNKSSKSAWMSIHMCIKSFTNTFHTCLSGRLFLWFVASTLVAHGGQSYTDCSPKHLPCPESKNKNPRLPQSISQTFWIWKENPAMKIASMWGYNAYKYLEQGLKRNCLYSRCLGSNKSFIVRITGSISLLVSIL